MKIGEKMKLKEITIAGIPLATLVLLPKVYKAPMAAIGIMAVKKRGDSVTITVEVKNTGEVDWDFGIGCSIRDASGQIWDIWDGIIKREQPGNGIDHRFIRVGETITHSWTVTIPSDMAIGDAQIRCSVWKESSVPVSTRLADTGWLSGYLSIAGQVAASITLKSVS
jgi:hypothetical protein